MIEWPKRNSWRRIEILFEKKPSLYKKFWSIYPKVLSVTWLNFTVVKRNSQIWITYHQMKFGKGIISRSSIKKLYLKIVKQLCWSLFLNKNADLQSWNFIKKRLQHRCFPVNIAKSLRTPVLKNICERLFERFPTWANNITSNIGSEEDIFSKTNQKTPF